MDKQRLRVFGAGVRGALVADLVSWQLAGRFEMEGYYDDRAGQMRAGPRGLPLLGTIAQGLDEVAAAGCQAFIALGTLASAKAPLLLVEFQRRGIPLATLVPPAALISPSATIGPNTLVMPGVFLGCEVRIGRLCTLHGNAVIEHHGEVGDNVLIGPGVAAASAVKIASHCFIGAGSSLIPEVRIGRGTKVGAGSAVVSDLPASVVAYGAPARSRRPVRAGDEVPAPEELAELAKLGF
jgi:sugar O-acyltransferase (sialic acid O-acetyltransferase NeuD family)